MRHIKIDINDNDQTLIKFLNKFFPKAPNSLIYKWIRTKKIKVNKKRVEPSTIIYKDDIVNIFIYDEEIEKWQKEDITVTSKLNLEIAYENKNIIVIDKPQNVLVHAADKKDYGNNVVDYIVDLLIQRKEYIPRLEPTFRPAVVNRIDRNTMGLVIGAKNRKTVLELNEAIETDKIKKLYLAIVHGNVDKEMTIKNKLLKDKKNIVRVSEEGKESKTIIRPIKNKENYSIVEIELQTGRTHQIRTTLKDICHPIIGDRKYGKSENTKLYRNQQLVAYKLIFSKNLEVNNHKELVVESKYKDYIFNLFNKLD
ncbi:RluA family pseudouridine synthase [Helcococcus kunzii]|uniref:RNA pseudouridylate synthase n=1 Tax=Helcococcus kunzii ATCC 51366 TaxID=883114 RepID=H3NNI6_9FIRM|nr:RluA family pseudouridine synthase [Helcococcus kunzii]EHR33961.1 RluA family pseudouridine synthase [Helcococcus kunzii ATCC 51366]MCT1795569.1 RluA family pseudouridine synthase [Helcococcus kunzii]MCT1989323.1 RluA family pseudouridine synthase [Helcococcus kunzii]QUY64812.1 RluA family pseudouridine synthase [Helcococcus kunzii]QZO77253.1 RluA family pseudouridine synthase [Helcococcus kunzii]